jgi:hypothetical protein
MMSVRVSAHDAGEQHKIPDRIFINPARVRVAEIGEPLDLGRHVGQVVDLRWDRNGG